MKLQVKYLFALTALALFSLVFTSPATAQKGEVQEKCLYHFDDLQRKQTWTDSYNPAGLGLIDFNSSSFMEAYMGSGKGDFVKYYEPNQSFNFGLRTASYTKIKKTTFFGEIDYNNFRGENMAWSGNIYPERYLMGVGNDVAAQKRKESYKLKGGLSVPILPKLNFGLQVNYETAMMAKRRDLRHRTDLLDFEAITGLLYKAEKFNLGVSYHYRKYYENVVFSKISDEINVFQGYIFKGLFFGVFDRWDVREMDLSRPFLDVIQGLSGQIEYVEGGFRLLNEFTYKYRDGYTGSGLEKAYSQNLASIFEYKGSAQLESGNVRHYLKVNSLYSDGVNYDKISTVEVIGGLNVDVQYGRNKIFSKRSFDFNALYELAIGRHKCSPEWNLSAGYTHYAHMAVSSLTIPFYLTQSVKVNSGFAKVNKNFVFSKGMVDLSLMGGYREGSGTRIKLENSNTSAPFVADDILLEQREDLLNREFEYLTKGRAFGEAGLRVSKFVTSKNALGALYLEAKYSLVQAQNIIYHAGNDSQFISLALGYSF
ncbi:MAG: DUF6850 family outer membrane beta-barrel protein [Bacteroidales bacterium]